MLAAIIVCVSLGLLAPRLGRREQLGLAGLAVLVTALYAAMPQRFM